MAKAAAKKAAAAQASAAGFYRPFLLIVNLVYLLIRYIRFGFDVTVAGLAGMMTIWALEYWAYLGILDNAAHHHQSSSSSKSSLVGGASLDLLGLVLVVQLGSILISPKFYWLLIVLPVWGVWSLYKMTIGGGADSSSKSSLFGQHQGDNVELSSEEKAEADKLAEKRQRRAERRRQKWS